MDPEESLAETLRNHIKDSIPSTSRGMTVLISKSRKVVFFESHGEIDQLNFRYRNETVYDLASLTKPVVTSTLVFRLIDRGKISLEDTIGSIGLFRKYGNLSQLTIGSLLSHTSGLTPSIPLYRLGKTRDHYLEGIDVAAASCTPNISENYSDLNYILLGFILEEIHGKTLDIIWEKEIKGMLKHKNISFTPDVPRDMVAPTEKAEDRGQVWGQVHDENSFFLGGVAGHAGLFSDAMSLLSFMESYLQGEIISMPSLKKATSPANLHIGGTFGYGWMINVPRPERPSPAFHYARFIGDIAPFGAFGHTGFTGTSIMVDPTSDLISIVLTNRVYPSRVNTEILRFRRTFHNLLFSHLSC